MFCLTNTGFVQCYSLGYHKFCCRLVFNFALFSNFCFAFFASQTKGFVQCLSFGSRKVRYLLLLSFIQNFVLRVLPTNTGLCSATPSAPVKFVASACVYFALFSNFLLCVFCLTNIGLVQCFSLRLTSSLLPFGFLCFIQFAFFMRALPNKLRFVQ